MGQGKVTERPSSVSYQDVTKCCDRLNHGEPARSKTELLKAVTEESFHPTPTLYETV
eukprot:gene13936-4088_t